MREGQITLRMSDHRAPLLKWLPAGIVPLLLAEQNVQ